MPIHIEINQEQLARFCRRHHIVRLSFFGSVLTEEFQESSDVDVLVEYHPHHIPDLLTLVEQEEELYAMLGRRADLRTIENISRYFKDEVKRNAVVQYAA